jgi:hypothetical protein
MRWIDAAETLSRQSFNGEGHLVCKDVPIARTGIQHYHISELPPGSVDAGAGGMVAVERLPSQVFAPQSVRSFHDVPVTLSHPDWGVDDSNRAELSVGRVVNPRRVGDRLVADLVITRRDAIDAIRNRGWRGVSCGYDANYTRTGPGRAVQTGIRGNHVAILDPGGEDARCGDLCRIGDAAWRQPMRPPANVMTSTPGNASMMGAIPITEGMARMRLGAMNESEARLWQRHVQRQVENDSRWCRDQLRRINETNAKLWGRH